MSNVNNHYSNSYSNQYGNNQPSSSSQVTQNMAKKYTILAEVKMLQDRLQDMFTNRSDMVNITGDGWAAAHRNEVKEILWVYLKSLGWISGFHGAILGVTIGVFGGLLAGVTFSAGLLFPAVLFSVVSAMFVVTPYGYMLYAEIITEESKQWVVGQNTQNFFEKMRDSMQFIVWNTWVISGATFIGILFFIGLFETTAISMSMAVLKAFGIVIPQNLQSAIFNNGSIYGISLFALTIAGFLIARVTYMDRIKKIADDKSSANVKTQNMYKYKDAVQEARDLYN